MREQLAFDFTHRVENNYGSQEHLDGLRDHFNKQCQKVYNWLMSGREITTESAQAEKVAYVPRRIKDLREKAVAISEKKNGSIKVWFMTPEQRIENKKLIFKRENHA